MESILINFQRVMLNKCLFTKKVKQSMKLKVEHTLLNLAHVNVGYTTVLKL